MIYGKLPPENRKLQALKFNDENSPIDYLVATNAIGLGINLKIRRIIFCGLLKKSADAKMHRIDEYDIR